MTRAFLHTIKLMFMIYEKINKMVVNCEMVTNKRQIKFTHHDKKYCLSFSSRYCDILKIDFAKQIRCNGTSIWKYDQHCHPYLRKEEMYDYVANYIVHYIDGSNIEINLERIIM